MSGSHGPHRHAREHGHDHGHGHDHHHTHADQGAGRLKLALGITTVIMLVEVVGGVWTNSLALLADAGHMLADAGSLLLAMMINVMFFMGFPPVAQYIAKGLIIVAAMTLRVLRER